MKKITIKGVEYPFRITIGAMVAYKRETGEDITSFDGHDMEKFGFILFYSLRSASRACSIDFPFASAEELLDYIDMQEAAALMDSEMGSSEVDESEKKS